MHFSPGHDFLSTATSCFAMLLLMLGCVRSDEAALPDQYVSEIEAWRSNRITGLTAPRSWTSLVGLHWLQEGAQSFGSGDEQDIHAPVHAPEHIGTWQLQGDSVAFEPKEDLKVQHAHDGRVFTGGRINTDADDNTHLLNLQSLYWMVINRADKYGVRIWDTLHTARFDLTTIPHFPVDPAWRLRATFAPADSGATLMVDNAVGLTVPVAVAGVVRSAIGRDSFSLIAFDGGPAELFLIFSDLTTDVTTYSGGRYLYIPRAAEDGRTVLDLNKAHNPPCVFTAYATCLLPPERNFIPVVVEAGEKMVEGGHE